MNIDVIVVFVTDDSVTVDFIVVIPSMESEGVVDVMPKVVLSVVDSVISGSFEDFVECSVATSSMEVNFSSSVTDLLVEVEIFSSDEGLAS